MDDGYCFTVRKIKVAKFKEPQIKRLAQRLFCYVLSPTYLPIKGSDG